MIKPISVNLGCSFSRQAEQILPSPQQKPELQVTFVEQRPPSLWERTKQYAKEHPYATFAIVAVGLTATAAATSLLYIGAQAARDTNRILVSPGHLFAAPVFRSAEFGDRAAAAQSAMGNTVKAAVEPVSAAVAHAYTATASTVNKAADATASAVHAAGNAIASGCRIAASAAKSAAHSTYSAVTYPFVASYQAAASVVQSVTDAAASTYNKAYPIVARGAATAVKRMSNWVPSADRLASVDQVFDRIEWGAKYAYETAVEAAQATKEIATNFWFGVPRAAPSHWYHDFFSQPPVQRPGFIANWFPQYVLGGEKVIVNAAESLTPPPPLQILLDMKGPVRVETPHQGQVDHVHRIV
jgi:hypothetical protein